MKRYMALAGIGVLLLAVTIGLQYRAGVYQDEFGAHPDEAGHFITGLMIRDYLATGCHGSPLRYAQEYYLHYPKVALGHWPPVFYLVQAAWMIVTPPSRAGVMVFMALLTAGFALTLYTVLRRVYSKGAAFAGAVFFLVLPIVQEHTGMVMSDIFSAWIYFVTALLWGRFMETGRWRDSLAFAVCAVVAVMTKGSAFLLALVPVVSIALTGRFDLVKRPAFWLPVVLVPVACLPWYLYALPLMKDGFENPLGLASTLIAIPYYLTTLWKALGPVPVTLMGVGMAAKLIPWNRTAREGIWVVAGSLLVSVFAFHFVMTNGFESRYLIPALAPAVMFILAGLETLAKGMTRLCRIPFDRAVVLLGGAAAVFFLAATFRIPVLKNDGYTAVADLVLARAKPGEQVLLISSDARGEGMCVSAFALKERRPGHYVLRASKALARSQWDGGRYTPLFSSPADVMGYLEQLPVGVIVEDRSVPASRRVAHHRLLAEAIRCYPDRWTELGVFDITRDGVCYSRGLSVHALTGVSDRVAAPVRLDAKRLGVKGL